MTSHHVRSTRGRARALTVAAVFALVLAACGGGGGSILSGSTTASGATSSTSTALATTAPPGSTASSATTSADTSIASTAADQAGLALSRAAALALADLPEGWTMDSEDESGAGIGEADDPEMEKACPDVYAEVKAIEADGGVPVGVSRSFSAAGGAPTVQSSPTVFASEDLADRAFDAIVGMPFAQCFADVITGSAAAGSGVGVGDTSVSEVPIEAGSLDAGGGYEAIIPMTQSGISVTVRMTLVALRSGRMLHLIVVFSTDGSAPFSGMQGIVEAAVARIEAA